MFLHLKRGSVRCRAGSRNPDSSAAPTASGQPSGPCRWPIDGVLCLRRLRVTNGSPESVPKNTRLVIIRINIFREIVTDRGFSRATKRSAQFPRSIRSPVSTGLAAEPVSHFAYAPSNAPRSGPRSQSRPHRTTNSSQSCVRRLWANVISKNRQATKPCGGA